jgi:putative ABC transport system permease protein
VLGTASVASRLLWANPGRLIVLVAGAISVALATSGIVLAASTSLAIVRQTVDAGWRGTYDLLVRPADAPSLSIGGHDLVPLDYLGLRTSGITRTQWQRIAQLSNVEVAAPVAALGWLKNATPGITAVLADQRPGVVYEIQARATIAGQDAVRRSGLIAFRNDRDEVDVGFPDSGGPNPTYVSFRDLPATWGLVVGIDPAAEDALIGLSGYVEGQYLATGTAEVFDQGFGRTAVTVPVLTAAKSPIPGDLTVTVSIVDGVTADQVEALYEVSGRQTRDQLEEAIERLAATGSPSRIAGDSAALEDLLPPLRWGGITLGPDGHLRFSEGESLGGGLLADDNVVLAPSLASYAPAGDDKFDLTLSSLGSWKDVIDPRLATARPEGWWPPATFGGDSSVYRDLGVTVPPAYMLTPVGTYDRDAIDAQLAGAANYAPLGIYAAIPRALVEDANGEPVDETLPLSINPAGLNPQPPVGLTNLEAVEALRGDQFIDAIRVRIGGISGYTPDAVRRIETVAKQVVETTGLHVDVIAGSSPVDVRVAVPGVGVIRERWTTLGTAAAIVSGAEGLSAGLLGAAFAVVVAYLAAFGVFLTGDQATETGILRRVGWRRSTLVGLVATQAVALGLVAAVLTVGLVIALAVAGGQRIDGAALATAAVAVLLAHPVAAGLAGFAGLGRRRPSALARARRPAHALGGLIGLAAAFAAEAPGRAVVAGLATALALTVAGLVAAIELAAGGELRTTLFGAVVAVRLAPYHLLAAAAALFAAGALILDGALLTVERRLSLIGVLRAVGWRSGAIRRLVTAETALPALLAGLVAAAAVGVVAAALGLGTLTLPLALGVLGLAVVLAAAATQLPASVAVRTAPAATLRAEGASAVVGGFAPRQALLTVTALVVIVSLVAGGWGAAEGAASRPLPFVTPTEHPLSAVARQIQSDVSAIAAYPDRAPGSASFEQALTYIGDALKAAGYDVTIDAYLSPQPTYLDAEGQAFDPAGVSSPALAYDAAAWDGRDLDMPATIVDLTSEQPPHTCPAGVIVLRIAEFARVPLAPELQQRCLGRTAAVLAVRSADDEAWAALSGRAARVRLPVAHSLTAVSPDAAASPNAPWLVVTLDSRGPGASMSAAPAAFMLAVARQAKADGVALRIGVVGASDQAAGSVFLERMPEERSGPIIWLGPMGGPVAPVLGTATINGLDRDAATAGLLWIAPVDSTFAAWLTRATAPSDRPTSEDLLGVLSGATGIEPGDESKLNAGPLTAGIDAAWLGEPSVVTVGPPSIAGTKADTAAQIHPRDLEQLAAAVVAALGELRA